MNATGPSQPSTQAAPRGRRSLDGVETPHRLGEHLPSLFQASLSPLEHLVVDELAAGATLTDLADDLELAPEALRDIVDAAMARLAADTLGAASKMAAIDDFVQRLCGALDGVMAPVLLTLDNLEAYVDPLLAPGDFLDWLAGWIALGDELGWTSMQRRALITEVVDIFGRRGTAASLQRLLELYTGAEVEVTDNGGSSWSSEPAAGPPAALTRPAPAVNVRIRTAEGRANQPGFRTALEAVIRAETPIDLRTSIEFVNP